MIPDPGFTQEENKGPGKASDVSKVLQEVGGEVGR